MKARENNITAYRVDGDILTSRVNGVVGPATNGREVLINGDGAGDSNFQVGLALHNMDRVKLGLDRLKNADVPVRDFLQRRKTARP